MEPRRNPEASDPGREERRAAMAEERRRRYEARGSAYEEKEAKVRAKIARLRVRIERLEDRAAKREARHAEFLGRAQGRPAPPAAGTKGWVAGGVREVAGRAAGAMGEAAGRAKASIEGAPGTKPGGQAEATYERREVVGEGAVPGTGPLRARGEEQGPLG